MNFDAYVRAGQIVLRVPTQVGIEGTGVHHLLSEGEAQELAASLHDAVEARQALADSHVVVLGEGKGVLCQVCNATWYSDAPLPIRIYERAIDTFASKHAGCREKAAP